MRDTGRTMWPCVALCGPVWPCVALCGPVWPCVALCGPVWPCVSGVDCAGLVISPWPARSAAVRLGAAARRRLVTVLSRCQPSAPLAAYLALLGMSLAPLVLVAQTVESGGASWARHHVWSAWHAVGVVVVARLRAGVLVAPHVRGDHGFDARRRTGPDAHHPPGQCGRGGLCGHQGAAATTLLRHRATDSFSFDNSAARDGLSRTASACFPNYDAVLTGGTVQVKWLSAMVMR